MSNRMSIADVLLDSQVELVPFVTDGVYAPGIPNAFSHTYIASI